MNYNYDNSTPDLSNRAQTENTKNISGIGNSNFRAGNVNYNYDNGIPDLTNRAQTENTKNITGQIGNSVQVRARDDYGNALLNTEKEVIAEGRTPVPVGLNRGPVNVFTKYNFIMDDNISNYTNSCVKPNTEIKNELFTFL